ncbi:hypothetical protein KW790_00365 [Candidatus Parcubacteria bacterium]|nr:hypothetical protein [Candidatus Parcubacteria bacterium]
MILKMAETYAHVEVTDREAVRRFWENDSSLRRLETPNPMTKVVREFKKYHGHSSGIKEHRPTFQDIILLEEAWEFYCEEVGKPIAS